MPQTALPGAAPGGTAGQSASVAQGKHWLAMWLPQKLRFEG